MHAARSEVLLLLLFALVVSGCIEERTSVSSDKTVLLRDHDEVADEVRQQGPATDEDVLNACLLLADSYFAGVDANKAKRLLDEMAEELRTRIRREDYPPKIVNIINHYLYDELGFTALSDPTDPSLLLPDRVLENKKGHCIGLAVIYLALAERLGLPVFARCLPEHIFLQYNRGLIRINIETTERGDDFPDRYYYNNFLTAPSEVSDAYLRKLSKTEVLGLFLLDVGHCLRASGRNLDAIDAWTKALDHCPGHPGILVNMGTMYNKLREVRKAERALLDAIKLDPMDWRAYHTLSHTYAITGQFQKAIDAELKVIELIDNAITVRHSDIRILREIHEMTNDMLEEQAGIILERPDAAVDDLLKLGIISFGKGRYELACRLFGRVLKKRPNSSFANISQAAAYFRRGMYQQALKHSKIADSAYGPSGHPRRFSLLINKLAECYHNLSALYFQLKEYHLVIEGANKTIEIRGPNPNSYSTLGYAYLNKVDRTKAIHFFRKALELDPTHEFARKGLSKAEALDRPR